MDAEQSNAQQSLAHRQAQELPVPEASGNAGQDEEDVLTTARDEAAHLLSVPLLQEIQQQPMLQRGLDLAAGSASSESSDSSSAEDGVSGFMWASVEDTPQEEVSQYGTDSQEDTSSESEGDGDHVHFDLAEATRHSYLGDVDDLEGVGSLLEDSFRCSLPLLPLDGVVLMPGDTLPLRLVRRSERQLAERALSAPQPLTRLIAVTCVRRDQFGLSSYSRMGCTAEVRQMRRQSDGSINCVAKGRQRMLLHLPSLRSGDFSRATVDILSDGAPQAVPREVAQRCAHWPPWAYRAHDAHALAKSARQLFCDVAPKAREFQGDPLGLSYWLASNLPLQDGVRQRLLEAACPAARLHAEIALLANMALLNCRGCAQEVASAKEVISMSEEGISGVFVNTHGYVHDMVTLRRVRGVALEGVPQTDNTWFPGYAWTIAHCASCAQHLGWRFTATRPHLSPREFWGLRRSTILDSREPD